MSSHTFQIVQSSLGRIIVPSDPPGVGFLFWTTIDFPGTVDSEATRLLLSAAREIGGRAERFETCRQVHGTNAVEVTRTDSGWSECSDCDALWTRMPGIALGIKVADCLPVTIIDESAGEGVVLNLHAGWRGAAAGIVGKAISDARAEGQGLSNRAHAWLGPSIRSCCFEVGEEVVDAFRPIHPHIDEFVDRTRSKPHIDLAGLVKRTLVDEGLAEDRIWDGGLCTRCPESLFHSFRRSGPQSGRNLAVAGR